MQFAKGVIYDIMITHLTQGDGAVKLSKVYTAAESDLKLVQDGAFDILTLANESILGSGVRALSFLNDEKYLDVVAENKAISCIITTQRCFEKLAKNGRSFGALVTEDPKRAFYLIQNYLVVKTDFYARSGAEIASSAVVDKTAVLAGNVSVGEGSVIGANTVLYDNVSIGNNVYIGANCSIGVNGWRVFENDGKNTSVLSGGGVVIEDDVNIQHNTVIEKGVFGGDTVIGQNCFVNSSVLIEHDSIIGRCSKVAGGVQIAGRVTIGSDAWIGLGVRISNGITIGDHAYVCIGSVVTKDVGAGKKVSGNFAVDHEKNLAFIKKIR
jgi:UDP-3-O-[3-hydroxymyristoyl] glucosamine N-acyltransferase